MGSQPETVPEARYFSMFEAYGYYNTDAVYLNAGAPGTELLRMLPPIIEAATKHLMQNELEGTAQGFQYGIEGGNWQFRSFLSTFLSEEYGDNVSRDELFLTGGASSGLWLALSCLFKPGSIVFVEDPSYFCALSILSDSQMKIVPVKTDDYGLVIDDFQEKLTEHFPEVPSVNNPPLQGLIYTIPLYHNPTGAVLPEERCNKLINLARKYGLTILCDDVYNLLHYDDLPVCPKRLFSFDKKSHPNYVGNVISNGSFSKILGPGLRIGWMEAPKWAIKKLTNFGVLQSGGGLNTYTSGIITSLLALGKLQAHLQKVKTIYKTHMDATAQLLREELPPGCTLKSESKGGYFLWVELPDRINATHLLPFAKVEYQVNFMPGSRTSPTGSYANCLRLCISFYPLDVLLPAIKRLCQAISDFQKRIESDPDFWKTYAIQIPDV